MTTYQTFAVGEQVATVFDTTCTVLGQTEDHEYTWCRILNELPFTMRTANVRHLPQYTVEPVIFRRENTDPVDGYLVVDRNRAPRFLSLSLDAAEEWAKAKNEGT